MPKARGDMKAGRPKSMGEIAQNFARSIGKQDDRYNRFWNYRPIDKFMKEGEFFSTEKRIKAPFGANRSTKTTVCAFEAVMIYTGVIPPAVQGIYAQEAKLRALTSGPGKRARYVRIIVMDYSEHWPMTIEPMLTSKDFGMLPETWSDYEPSTHMFHGPDGSIMDVYSADPNERDEDEAGERKLRGSRIDLTWIDEINRYSVFAESRVRPAAHPDSPGLITLSFCPQEGRNSWTTTSIVEARYELKGGVYVEKPVERQDPDVYSVNVSMKDNPSISQEEYERQKRGFKDWEWPYRVDGWPTNRTSNVYFCMDDLVKWEEGERYSPGIPVQVEEIEASTDTGKFVGKIVPIENESLIQKDGILDEAKFPIWRVWEAARDGEKYILTADISEGNQKSDPHSASIWKATDPLLMVQVAQLHMTLIKPGSFATQCCCMANVYGDCLIVPEQNNTGGGMFLQQALHYKNLYRRQKKVDTETREETEKLGWHTDRYNKGPMLDNAYRMLGKMAAVRLPDGEDENGKTIFKNHCPFKSRATILEFEGYEERLKRDPKTEIAKTEWGARLGSHDDTVIEACIAFQIVSNEFFKLSACKLSSRMVHNRKDEHYLGEKQGETPRPFSKYQKQQKLGNLRTMGGASNGGSS